MKWEVDVENKRTLALICEMLLEDKEDKPEDAIKSLETLQAKCLKTASEDGLELTDEEGMAVRAIMLLDKMFREREAEGGQTIH